MLKEIKIQSPDKSISGHLNTNSVRNRFEAHTYIIDNNIELLLISEIKLDDSLLIAQFQMKISVFHIDMTEMENAVYFFCTFTRTYNLNY